MKPVKFLFISDLHCPLIDLQSMEYVYKRIGEYKPDEIIIGGDLFEADSASRWPSEHDFTLADEFKCANEILANIRKSAGKSKLIFLPGNHDDNIIGINRIDKKLRGLCDYRNGANVPELQNWLQPCKYIYDRKRGSYKIGQVVFSHGYEANATSGRVEAVYMANEYGLYVHGHTHRPHEVKQAMLTGGVPLRFWYANAGTLRQFDCDYMMRKRQALWGSAIITGEAMPIKSPRIGKQWSAQTEIFKMYNED